MVRTRRIGFAAALCSSVLLLSSVASVAAAGTYTATICFDAANTQVDIHQVWSGMEVTDVTGGIGTKGVGFGFDNAITPSTSGDETDALFADPSARTVGAAVLDNGVTVGSLTLKRHGTWAKTLPAC